MTAPATLPLGSTPGCMDVKVFTSWFRLGRESIASCGIVWPTVELSVCNSVPIDCTSTVSVPPPTFIFMFRVSWVPMLTSVPFGSRGRESGLGNGNGVGSRRHRGEGELAGRRSSRPTVSRLPTHPSASRVAPGTSAPLGSETSPTTVPVFVAWPNAWIARPVQAQNAAATATITQFSLSCLITAPPSRGLSRFASFTTAGRRSGVPGMNDQVLSFEEKT